MQHCHTFPHRGEMERERARANPNFHRCHATNMIKIIVTLKFLLFFTKKSMLTNREANDLSENVDDKYEIGLHFWLPVIGEENSVTRTWFLSWASFWMPRSKTLQIQWKIQHFGCYTKVLSLIHLKSWRIFRKESTKLVVYNNLISYICQCLFWEY